MYRICSDELQKEIVQIYNDYINNNLLQLDPIQEIMEFLNIDNEALLNDMLNNTQRIIIIGKEFDKEFYQYVRGFMKMELI